jgi:hypothetical protein
MKHVCSDNVILEILPCAAAPIFKVYLQAVTAEPRLLSPNSAEL